MRASRGFTLVEAMVGMVILAVIVAGALSFFILWSSRSAESFRYKTADEGVATAISLLTTDIRKAGFGVTSTPEYGIFVVDNGANADELYLSYGDYLNLEGDIRAPTSDTLSVPYRSINSVFMPNRQFTVGSLTLSYQGRITLSTGSNFVLRAIPSVQGAAHYSGCGAVITSTPAAADVDINTTTYVAGQIPGTQDWTIPLVSPARNAAGGGVALAAGMVVTPAISYKRVPGTGAGTGALWRNRGKESSPFGTAILGGTPYLDVTDFQVRLQFTDASWSTTNTQPTNVRLIEATISYRVMISKDYRVGPTGSGTLIKGWGPVIQRRVSVSPRSVALAQM
jgi:prepilin-type N-terminal cleavage/methylation domain-containing protein